jgi:hypothetical protein
VNFADAMIVKTPDGRERQLIVEPAFDKRHVDPKKNYGIHGVEMRFVVSGPEGAVQFLLYTNWQMPAVREEWKSKERAGSRDFPMSLVLPMPADLGFHSRAPVEYATEMKTCPFLDGADCWYDGSGLNAESYFDVLCSEGLEALWVKLEGYYDYKFKGGSDE